MQAGQVRFHQLKPCRSWGARRMNLAGRPWAGRGWAPAGAQRTWESDRARASASAKPIHRSLRLGAPKDLSRVCSRPDLGRPWPEDTPWRGIARLPRPGRFAHPAPDGVGPGRLSGSLAVPGTPISPRCSRLTARRQAQKQLRPFLFLGSAAADRGGWQPGQGSRGGGTGGVGRARLGPAQDPACDSAQALPAVRGRCSCPALAGADRVWLVRGPSSLQTCTQIPGIANCLAHRALNWGSGEGMGGVGGREHSGTGILTLSPLRPRGLLRPSISYVLPLPSTPLSHPD